MTILAIDFICIFDIILVYVVPDWQHTKIKINLLLTAAPFYLDGKAIKILS